jgi:uncharacterized protein
VPEDSLTAKTTSLLAALRSYESCAVALSGGVDSAVATQAAFLALRDKSIAITGSSASLANAELEYARQVATFISIEHVILPTSEFETEDYRRNAPDRCYHCKSELYTRMGAFAVERGIRTLVNGANADDLGDYRPGMDAAREFEVRTPLADCGITKEDVRALAREWRLPIWDKPASPCLSSRIAYGEEVTPERVAMIERAEAYLRGLGFQEFRVRYHRGDLARIEVAAADIPRISEEHTRRELTRAMRAIGFKFVTVDLEGFRSGSLNVLIPVEALGGIALPK